MPMPKQESSKPVGNRQMYVTAADVERYGGTEGCQACVQVTLAGKTAVAHSHDCRRRMQGLMEGDEEGKERLRAHRKKRKSYDPAEAKEEPEERPAPPGEDVDAATGSGQPAEAPARGDQDGEERRMKRSGEETTETERKSARPDDPKGQKRNADEDREEARRRKTRQREEQPKGKKRESETRIEELDPNRGASAGSSALPRRLDADGDVEVMIRPDDEATAAQPEVLCLGFEGRKDVHRIGKLVVENYRAQCKDITFREAEEIASLAEDIGAIEEEANEGALRARIRKGFILELSPSDWKDEESTFETLKLEDPIFVVGESTSRGKKELEDKELRMLSRVYANRLQNGGKFIHEAPRYSRFWKDSEVNWMLDHGKVHRVRGPMRRVKGKTNEFIRLPVDWITNDEELAKLLTQGRLDKEEMNSPSAIVMMLKQVRNHLNHVGALGAEIGQDGGPHADLPDLHTDPEWREYWDDVNGGMLDSKLTQQARKLEMDWVKKEKVYEYRCKSEAQEKGITPIPLLWIDTNKGDLENPFVRSRLVVRERTKGRNAREALPAEQLFSAMPPLEALKLLLSLKVTKKVSKRGKKLKIAHWDISRAHFVPKAERDIYVELPEEDEMKKAGMVGKLLRTMYGTQDASRLWQKDYTELLVANTYRAGISNPALFYSATWDARMLVHGDDFVMLADEDAISHMDSLLKSKYTVKMLANMGDGDKVEEAVVLNRVIRYVPCGPNGKEVMELEADQRHVEVIVEELGLNATNAKGVDVPRVKRSEKEVLAGAESSPLERGDTRKYRSATMRASYLGQDRTDIQEATKCLAQKMKGPNEYDLTELKRLGRYLMRKPRSVLMFEEQPEPRELEAWVDSDYAGDVISRKSTSGLVLMYGKHLLKSSSSVQGPLGLSSGESEYYACVKGGCYILGVRSLMLDWGMQAKLVLNVKTDSSAAKGFAGRRGLGKQRHVSTRYLWLQDRVCKGELRIVKVRTEDQLADPLTKALAGTKAEDVWKRLGLEFREGRAAIQRKSLVKG